MMPAETIPQQGAGRRIRVLHTVGWISEGGVEQLRLLMARCLPKDRYEHLAICQGASGVLPDLLKAEGWDIHVIGDAPHILSPAWHAKAARIARDFSPHIVHGAVIEGVALATGIGLRDWRVKVVSEETSDPVDRSWRGNFLMRAMCLRSDVVIGVSPRVGEYLTETAHVPKRKVRVIDNAVLPAPQVSLEETGAIRSELGLRPDDLVIGSVGRLVDAHKRFSDVIRAVSILQSRGGSNLRLLIVGDGTDRAALQDLCRTLGMEERVIFTGYRGDVRRLYSVMDIFVLASAHEAFGLVLAEAMMAGVPVVATRAGGMPHVLDQGRAGRLVSPLQPEELASELLTLVSDRDTRLRLGEIGRLHAEAAFSADGYCRKIDALYRELLM